MSKPKVLAFLSYLLSILGCFYVLLFERKNKLAVYHAKQSLTIVIVAVGAVVVWLLGTWVLTWIPIVGPLLATALFSQIILLYVFLVVVWVIGIVYALQAKRQPLPLIGKWAEQLFA